MTGTCAFLLFDFLVGDDNPALTGSNPASTSAHCGMAGYKDAAKTETVANVIRYYLWDTWFATDG
jgi:hypothetical protein